MLTAPVLVLNTERINEINPRNVENLFGMWSVFSRCATTIHEGKRLENMSWRIWGRETLCCPPQPERTIVPAIDVSPARSSGVPSLSSSVESDTSIEDKMSALSSRERCRKLSESEDSALSKSRGKEPHLSSHTLEKIVTNIQEKSKLEPLSPAIEAVVNAKMQTPSSTAVSDSPELTSSRHLPYSTESSRVSTNTVTTVSTARQSEHRDSETSVSSTDGDGLIRSGSVVHGFSPATSSFRSTKLRMSQGLSNLASRNLIPARPMKFTLGGSSEEDESSFDSRMSFKRPLPDKRTSSLSQSISKGLDKQKKVTSFRDIVEQRRSQDNAENDEGAIASSDEEDDDDIMDSAIEEEDDEEGDWEDDEDDNRSKGLAEKPAVFQRIDSRPNLVSRRSILTQGLTESDRAKGLANAATKSQPTIRRNRTVSQNETTRIESVQDKDEDSGLMMQAPKGSKPLPIIPTTSNTYAMAHSPRTTRRNMLSTELTESLRKNLLWERQQKNTNKGFVARQAQSMANLQRAAANADVGINGVQDRVSRLPPLPPQPPQAPPLKNNSSWTFENPWEYHAKGW